MKTLREAAQAAWIVLEDLHGEYLLAETQERIDVSVQVRDLLAALAAPPPVPAAWMHSHGGLVYHCSGADNEAMRAHGWTPLYKET